MAGPDGEVASLAALGSASNPGYSVTHQEVELDVDFASRTLTGKTAITVQPFIKDLKHIHLHCRGIDIRAIKVDRHPVAAFDYRDPYSYVRVCDGYTVNQHHFVQAKVDKVLRNATDPELKIPLPRQFRVRDVASSIVLSLKTDQASLPLPPPVTDTSFSRSLDDGAPLLRPFTVYMDYVVKNARDGLHWVGAHQGDARYPHVYTSTSSLPGTPSSFVFPCLDNAASKCTWRFTIKCPRTLADIIPEMSAHQVNGVNSRRQTNGTSSNGVKPSQSKADSTAESAFASSLSEEEKAMDISVVCSGYMEDSDASTESKSTKRKWVFHCSSPVAPVHIGFVVGPFEQIDLSEFRESDQDERLGQNAVRVYGFCLPGRSDELRNTCMPLAMAIDKFTTTYGSYPFESETTSYSLCFVDDLPHNVIDTATVSICSSRLLIPENILDPLYESSRELIRAVASQWIGVNVVAKTPSDYWIIVGGSYFMTDLFMQGLWGKNEYRFRQKQAADRIHELDVKRPSVYDIGLALAIDPSELEFLKLKAPVILFILHQRLLKASGRNGVDRIFWRTFLDVKVGKLQNGEIDTEKFLRTCEKVGHAKLDSFFNQWVYNNGCPTFRVTQRFNKKKLVVEMLLTQVHADDQVDLGLDSDTFIRAVKEHEQDIYMGSVQPLFTGPMTIRIHEADGTPYEHIVDIKEVSTKVEIPYNTKYKRLKRNRRQKERAAAAAGLDITGETQDDVLLYCLGDVLQSEEEMKDWDLADWSREDEDRMGQESYEWIRLDKDFEWICKIHFNQPHYMWVSQLQQDNDVVAQVESLQYLLTQQPFKLVSTILIRTLMDPRYFYGIRIMAAYALARCATPGLNWVGLYHLEKAFQEFFCFEDSAMTRSNDFSDVRSYKIQCAIPAAISSVRDADGKAPDRVKKFFLDKLKFNDNSNNEYSDCFYVSSLISCLAQSLITTVDHRLNFSFGDMEQESRDAEFLRLAMDEIQRFRRIDEWIPSFQNLYTVTALESMRLLMQKRVAPRRIIEFMQYTQPENSDPVRLKAFECLVDLGMFSNPAILRYFLYSLQTEQSPYMRDSLWHVLAHGLGRVALIDPQPETDGPIGGLVIEGEAMEARQAALARKQTVQGSMAALKRTLGEVQEFKDALLDAMRSPLLGLSEFLSLLTVCRILYDPTDHLIFKRRLPAFYRAKHLGDGKVAFIPTGRYRTKPLVKLELKRPRPTSKEDDGHSKSPEAKRRRTSMSVGSSVPQHAPQAQSSGPPLLLKLNTSSTIKVIPAPSAASVPAPPAPKASKPLKPPKAPKPPKPPKIQVPKAPKPPKVPKPPPSQKLSLPSQKKSVMVKLKVPSEFLANLSSDKKDLSSPPSSPDTPLLKKASSFILPMANSGSTLSASQASSPPSSLTTNPPHIPSPPSQPLPPPPPPPPQIPEVKPEQPKGFKLKLKFGGSGGGGGGGGGDATA